MGKDCSDIMLHGVDFRDVKVVPAFANIIVREIMEITVECKPGFMELGKGIICVGLKVCIIYEVECCTHKFNFDQARIGLACKNAQKYFLHVLILCAGPLRDKRDPLGEVTVGTDCELSSAIIFGLTLQGCWHLASREAAM